MFDGLYSEFLKFKRTNYYISLVLCGLVCLYFCTLNRKAISQFNWYGYFYNFELAAFTFFYAVVIPTFVALIFTREFKYKTAPTVFSYPSGRSGAFMDKFLMSILVTAVVYIMSYIFIVLSGLIFLKEPLEAEFLINHFKVFLISFAFQVALVPLTILVALLGKNMIISVIYALVLMIANSNYFLGSKYKKFIFSILPAAPVAKLKKFIYLKPIPLDMVISNRDIRLGIFVFVIGIAGCIIFYRKADIY